MSRRLAAVAAVVAAAAWVMSLAMGRLPFAVATLVLLGLGYLELRRALAGPPSPVSVVAGFAGVAAFVAIGSAGRVSDLPWVVAGVLTAVLGGRVMAAEVASVPIQGATADVSATVAAACMTGLLGAHVLLVRATSRFGIRGAIVLATLVVAWRLAAAAGSGAAARRTGARTAWVRAGAGGAAAAVAGTVTGAILTPPFGAVRGLAFGAAVGVVAPVGDAAIHAVRRGASETEPAPGVLGLLGGPLVCAPLFYWAFRILVL